MYEQAPGITFTMKIMLPYEGPIIVKGETLYRRDEYGFAVRFVQMDDATAERLERVIEQLQDRAPYDE